MEQISPQLERAQIRTIADNASAEINQAIKLVKAAKNLIKNHPADLNGLTEIELSLQDLLADMWNRSNKRRL